MVRGVGNLDLDAGELGVLAAQIGLGARAVGELLEADPRTEDQRRDLDFGQVVAQVGGPELGHGVGDGGAVGSQAPGHDAVEVRFFLDHVRVPTPDLT